MPKYKKIVRQGRAKVAKMIEARRAKRNRQNSDETPTTSKDAQQNYFDSRLKDNQSDEQPPIMDISNIQPMEISNNDLREDFAGDFTETEITEETNKNIVEFQISYEKEAENKEKIIHRRIIDDAIQAKKAEEERILREAQLAKQKAHEAEKAKLEAARAERELQKKSLRKEKKSLRDLCKLNKY
ncbi:uncharacterized protein LOC126970354 [Leptidea sinapis]|uniref:uncharacterized protein LOC126970354 n=1 Tax=Leptidea sinapis TaxID=189913 RepID=UPI0021C4C041|nr:uncharacterized protein LOC126970354 [Leptidea sinapis]